MKLQKIINRLQKLHPKEIDLSLDRIKKLCKKLGNPQDKIKAISVVGTNGKNSTISAIFSILKEANIKCNVFTSPHILKINERFVFNNKELSDDELADLFEEVESINENKPVTFFEILTASYFYKAAQYPDNINLVEAGLFHRFDATNILKENLASVVCSCSIDHTDWLQKDERTIPMSKALYEAIKDMPLVKGSDDPIWPNRYKSSDDSWGHHHCNEFKNKYGLPSHDLRRFGITALINEGVSPYRIWDVVRHKIPGMSEVTMMYNRPTTKDLIKAMEVIAK